MDLSREDFESFLKQIEADYKVQLMKVQSDDILIRWLKKEIAKRPKKKGKIKPSGVK